MPSTPLFTFQDAGEHIDNVFNPAAKPGTGRDARMRREAIINAYRAIPSRHRWSYFQRMAVISTEASYSTGTIAYDHTGGVYERELTLTDGTWPSNAARGYVIIDDVHYPVSTRESGSIVTLDPNNNPGSDVNSGTSFVWYRDAYPLPVGFLTLNEIVDVTDGSGYPITYCSPSEHLQRSRNYGGAVTSQPEWYTIRNDGDYVGDLVIVFGRPPSSARSYEISYSHAPRALKVYKESTGTIDVTAGTATVSGSGTAFSSNHIGSVIRFTTSSSDEPTSIIGNVDGTDNPFLEERIVTSVDSTTSLTIDSYVSSSTGISSAKYTISDPIDIEPYSMLQYFLRLCELEYSKIAKREDWKEHAVWANEALMDAIDSDIRDRTIKSGMLDVGYGTGYTFGDVTTGGAGE
jgi:hypothetical protein